MCTLKVTLSPDKLLSSYGHIVEGARGRLMEFRRVLIMHVPRQGNSVVHSLVRLSRSLQERQVWMEPGGAAPVS
ncbi:hypothetical protein HYC85_011093 [Camellia sinensis]|uniref:RNase H type-1 domain-containing protein n=1 Tax=Camellia sinensis TaxID=4442 RepID=A0A7J7HKC1_CAMSI|nr:hypothetical protein HYC85_011093 [Camellia sinensis]